MILPTSPSQTAKRKCPAGLECGTNSGSDLVKWDLPTNTGPIPLCSQTWPLYSSLMLVLHLSPWQCLCPQGLTWTMSSACSLNKQDATLDLVSPPLNACHHPHPPPLPLWPGSHPHPSVVRIPFALAAPRMSSFLGYLLFNFLYFSFNLLLLLISYFSFNVPPHPTASAGTLPALSVRWVLPTPTCFLGHFPYLTIFYI